MRRAFVALTMVSLLGPVSTAAGHDSLAPAGAAHQWLPDEPWVMEHRIPFDQAVMQRELGLRGWRLEAYLFNDHHTLAMLARRRGIDVDALADRLVAPWRGRVTVDRLATLRERTMRLLTQAILPSMSFFMSFTGWGCGRSHGGCSASRPRGLTCCAASGISRRCRSRAATAERRGT